MGKKKIHALSGIEIHRRPLFSSGLGLFSEIYRKNNFTEDFSQDSFSVSNKKNTLRGMHFQKPPFGQAKLVTVLSGSIVDFVNYLGGSSLTSEGDLVISRLGFNSIFLLKGSYLPTSLF